MRLGIKGKIVTMNIAILVVAILSIYAVTIYTLYNKVINNSIDMLKKESYTSQSFVMNYLETEDNFHVENVLNEMSPFISTYLSNKCKFRVQIYNNSDLIGDSDDYPSVNKDEDVVSALKGNKSYIIRKIEDTSYILFSSPIYYSDGTIGCVRYVYNLDNENTIITNTTFSMILFAVVALIFSSIMSNSFSNRIVKPIVILKNIARKVSHGDFSKKISIKSNDEIEELSNSFNIMSNNIEIMIDNLKEEKETQKRFLDNVTHEFKTPLAAILGYSDLLLRVKEKKDIEQCVKYIVKSSNRLLKLVEQLLDLSRLNKNEVEIKCENIDIKSVVENSVMMLNPRMNKFGINLKMNVLNRKVYADKEKIEQVILNILDNAIKYSDCTEINVYMEENQSYIVLCISDNGQGIPKEDLEKVFENFYTAHKALQKKYGGSGLGLSICKEFMEKQFGKIEISSSNGTTVKLSFKHSI